MSDIENNNNQFSDVKLELGTLVTGCEDIYSTFEEKRLKVVDLKKKFKANLNMAWGDSGLSRGGWEQPAWSNEVEADVGSDKVRYRALYEFVARKHDELSFQPGDIILVTIGEPEPGWLFGEIHGESGWFPESYVERLDVGATENSAQEEAVPKQPLEGIQEVPESVSENGSVEGPHVDITYSPDKEQAEPVENIQAEGIYPWRAKKMNHLSFNKGDKIIVRFQQELWWYGEANSMEGWFPKSYVKLTSVVAPANSLVSAPPSEGQYYVALYPYSSVEPGDLTFEAGEMILVTRQEGDWWTGTLGTRSGIFPSNYVEQAAVAAYKGYGRRPEIATVLAPYQATSKEQLNLQRGQLISIRKKSQTGWWEGELQAKGKKRQIGWFPASYVKILGSGSARTTPIPVEMLDEMPSLQILNAETQNQVPQPAVQKERAKVIAQFMYVAQHSDELSFQKDDVISVINKSDPDWWKGDLNGVVGMFPSNYVEPYSEDDNIDLR